MTEQLNLMAWDKGHQYGGFFGERFAYGVKCVPMNARAVSLVRTRQLTSEAIKGGYRRMSFASKRNLAAMALGATMIANMSPALASTSTVKHNQQRVHATASSHSGRYVIKPGDTFWKISQRFHVSLNALLKANPHVKATRLIPGHTIVIPNQATHQTASHKATQGVHMAAMMPAYTKEINAVATAYTGAQGAVDCLGNKVHFGTVAVDPKVIPLGSTIRIEGMSFPGFPSTFIAHATDEGGAIKGNRIDIFLPVSNSQAMRFGVQHVKVYVLK
jgi:3D (Asp-Asp-Asp) domain-containing protein